MNEHELFTMTDQPECCRKCGTRVEIIDDDPDSINCDQIVKCPECGFEYGLCEPDEEDEEFEPEVPVQNSNSLQGRRCPECKSLGPFSIEAKSVFKVYDEGTDSYADVEWDDDSFTVCHECNHSGQLREFQYPYKCQNCEMGFEEEDIEKLPVKFPDIPHLFERIAPGEPVPYGECPECGALVHAND